MTNSDNNDRGAGRPPKSYAVADSDAQAPISPDITRRTLLGALAATAGIAAATSGTSSAETRGDPQQTAPGANSAGPQLIVLGTGGGPVVGPDRQMSGYIVAVDDHLYLVDCGYGVALQIARAGLDLRFLDSVFVTHHHPDHNMDLGSVLMLTWLNRRHDDIKVYGPPPIKQMVADYRRMMAPTIDLWIKDLKVPAFPTVSCRELSQAGTVMNDTRVRVSATVVQHPPIVPALAYRFDIGTRSIVFSGDTVPRDELVQLATGADILVHEAMNGPVIEQMIRTTFRQRVAAQEPYAEEYSADEWIKHMRRGHTPVAEVGRIAAKAGVKTLVLSHLVPSVGIKDTQWRADAARHFRGRIVVARDLMTLPI